MSPKRQFSPAGYQRRHGVKANVSTGETLGARRRKIAEERSTITVSGKCGSRHDDIVITISGHHTKRGWAERALERLQEQFALIGVELNQEKTKVVNLLHGEAFGFLGFDLRRTRKRKGEGYFILMTPKKKARQAVKAKVRDLLGRSG